MLTRAAAALAADALRASAAAWIPASKPGGDRFHIAFDAADLSGEENLRVRFHLQRLGKQRGRIDVGVAVNLPVAQEARILESGDQAQDAGLLAELQMILKSDEVVGIGAQIFLAQLHDCVRHSCRSADRRSPTGFIGPKRRVSRPRRAISSMGRQLSK